MCAGLILGMALGVFLFYAVVLFAKVFFLIKLSDSSLKQTPFKTMLELGSLLFMTIVSLVIVLAAMAG